MRGTIARFAAGVLLVIPFSGFTEERTPYRFESLKNASIGEIFAFMARGKSEYDLEREAIIRSRLQHFTDFRFFPTRPIFTTLRM